MKLLLPSRAAPGELRFVHSAGASLVIGLLGTVGAVLMWTLMPDTPMRVLFVGTAAVTAFRFLGRALRRYELVIEIEARRWRRRSGFFFAPRTVSGSLNDLRAVALDLRHMRTGSGSARRSVPVWSVSLEFAGASWDGAPLHVGMIENDEPRAYRLLEHYARRLRVDAVDRTAVEASRRSWNALERAQPVRADDGGAEREPFVAAVEHAAYVAAPRSDVFLLSSPPLGSGIEVTLGAHDRPRILLPAQGATAGTVLAGVIGLLIGALGALFVISGLGFGPLTESGTIEPLIVVVGSVFVWTGIGALAAAWSRARSREWVVELPDSLRFGVTRNGRRSSGTDLRKGAIEEVSLRTPLEGGGRLDVMGVRIRADPAKHAIIRVRTDTDLVRLGRRLTPEAKLWLRDTLAAAAGVRAG